MYPGDLADKAGVKFAERPTWNESGHGRECTIPGPERLRHLPRGKPGWGDNMAFITTMVNTLAASGFDMGWKPQLENKPWKGNRYHLPVDLAEELRPPWLVVEQLQ